MSRNSGRRTREAGSAGSLYRGGPSGWTPPARKKGGAADSISRLVSRALFWTALALLLLSVYGLLIRFDDFRGEIRMVSHQVRDGILNWGDFLTKYMWDLRTVPAAAVHLLWALLSICVLCLCRSRRACAWLTVPAAVLAVLGFLEPPSFLMGWLRGFKTGAGVLLAGLCALKAWLRPGRKEFGPGRNPGFNRPHVLEDGRRMAPPAQTARNTAGPLRDNRAKDEISNSGGMTR